MNSSATGKFGDLSKQSRQEWQENYPVVSADWPSSSDKMSHVAHAYNYSITIPYFSLCPSKCKVKRVNQANCWKYFKEIQVTSKKEAGVMVTKAKCKFCYKSYVYHPSGPTSQLNRHL